MKICPSELALDIDGVIADTMTLFIEIAREDFGICDIRYEDIKEYSLHGIGGVDELIMMKIIYLILDGKYSGTLNPLDGAPVVLQKDCLSSKNAFFCISNPPFYFQKRLLRYTRSKISLI